MAYNKVVYNGNTLIDLTEVTVTADTLAQGIIAHSADGSIIEGLMESGSYEAGSITISSSSVYSQSITFENHTSKPSFFAFFPVSSIYTDNSGFTYFAGAYYFGDTDEDWVKQVNSSSSGTYYSYAHNYAKRGYVTFANGVCSIVPNNLFSRISYLWFAVWG